MKNRNLKLKQLNGDISLKFKQNSLLQKAQCIQLNDRKYKVNILSLFAPFSCLTNAIIWIETHLSCVWVSLCRAVVQKSPVKTAGVILTHSSIPANGKHARNRRRTYTHKHALSHSDRMECTVAVRHTHAHTFRSKWWLHVHLELKVGRLRV